LAYSKTGDAFNSLNAAAKDFGKTTNPQSIQTDWEYGTGFYSWQEKGKTKYSYTDPHTDELPASARIDLDKLSKPDNAEWAATGHTHGAYKDDYNNDGFSDYDRINAINRKLPSFLVATNGSLPHDKNHPDLPWLHGWLFGCKNCFEYQGDC